MILIIKAVKRGKIWRMTLYLHFYSHLCTTLFIPVHLLCTLITDACITDACILQYFRFFKQF